MGIKVKVRKTGETCNNTCNCKDWLTHWRLYARKPAVFCSESYCKNMFGLKGALVEKKGYSDLFVIPLCAEHIQEQEEFEVNDFTILIYANTD
tara:strand:- start:14102 stop:14380 length:279 start_codon:yes stop_codon:yes gene_type:complete